MRHKGGVKLALNLVMYLLFLLLMGKHLISATFHEWFGVGLFVCFILHNNLNYKWYKSLFKGKYTELRSVQMAINILLILAVLGCFVSSLMISGVVFSRIRLPNIELGREFHMLCTAWGFVLMSVHLGLHIRIPKTVKTLRIILSAIALAIAIYGIFVFAERRLWEELFLLAEYKWFDYDKTVLLYLLETFSVSMSLATLTLIIKRIGLNMKKPNELISLFLVCMMISLGVGCSGQSDTKTPGNNSEMNPSISGESKVLIAYFSWSGNTNQLAEMVQVHSGGELFRIVPETPYAEDFDGCATRAQNELNDGTRPPLSSHIEEEVMAEYDVILLGFPIWWYDLPMPVWTFLEEYDFSGKTIIPFFTHNGSSNGAGSLSSIEDLCFNSIVKTDNALSIQGIDVGNAEEQVKEWISELGL